ncbi:MAG: hypothetical protein WC269_05155 [Candidatus Gracilibacteria bacterium]|jgi:hypothetical protein
MIKKIRNKYKQKKLQRAQKKEYLKTLHSAFDNAVISWVAPEYLRHKRGKIWKVLMTAAVIAAVVIGVLQNAWTFSLAIVTFVAVYYLINREHPKNVEVIVSNIGIKVGERKYPYGKIKAFWINYNPPLVKTLNIRVHGDLALDIAIQLNDQDPSVIREILIEKIPELEGQKENLTDIFLRAFKI